MGASAHHSDGGMKDWKCGRLTGVNIFGLALRPVKPSLPIQMLQNVPMLQLASWIRIDRLTTSNRLSFIPVQDFQQVGPETGVRSKRSLLVVFPLDLGLRVLFPEQSGHLLDFAARAGQARTEFQLGRAGKPVGIKLLYLVIKFYILGPCALDLAILRVLPFQSRDLSGGVHARTRRFGDRSPSLIFLPDSSCLRAGLRCVSSLVLEALAVDKPFVNTWLGGRLGRGAQLGKLHDNRQRCRPVIEAP